VLFVIFVGTRLSAQQIMSCPPDNDDQVWRTHDGYAECDPLDGSDGTRSGTLIRAAYRVVAKREFRAGASRFALGDADSAQPAVLLP
jgi:hypothetical protein